VGICDFTDPACEVATALAFNVDLRNDDDFGQPFCVLDAGPVEVTTLTADRATGSFSGAGLCFTDPTAVAEPVAITISNGRFDVPLAADFG
jgi:hypothetical protein